METGKPHCQGLSCCWFWWIIGQLCLQSLLFRLYSFWNEEIMGFLIALAGIVGLGLMLYGANQIQYCF